MQMIEMLACILPLLLMISLFVLSERLKRSARQRRARAGEPPTAEQQIIQGKASDDATPPYFFS